MNTYVLLMMGGTGSRFGASIPKQFVKIEGKPLFAHIAQKLSRIEFVRGIVIVVHEDWMDYTKQSIEQFGIKNIVAVVVGGATRSESVFNGLRGLETVANDDDVILMHDVTHPYVDEAGTLEVVRLTHQYGSATLASLNYDTTYMIDDNRNIVQVVPRQNIIAGASPEGFKYRQIYDIYASTPVNEMEKMTSVGAIALAHHIPMKVVPTTILNLKITYPEDMKLLRLLFKNYFFNEQ